MAHAMFKNCFVHFSVFSTAYVYIFRMKSLWWQRQLVQAGYELRKVIKYRVEISCSRAPVIPRFWKIQKTYLKVSKRSEKNHARSQWYILKPCKFSMQNIWGFELHKNEKMYRSEYSEQCIVSNLQLLSFLCSSNSQVFYIEFFHGCSIYHWECVWFFSDLFKTFKYVF